MPSSIILIFNPLCAYCIFVYIGIYFRLSVLLIVDKWRHIIIQIGIGSSGDNISIWGTGGSVWQNRLWVIR